MRSRRRWLARIATLAALVGFGIVLGLISLELMLWLAGPLLRPSLRGFGEATAPSAAGTIRVLCVGDSHTFGLWVPPEDSYPVRLQHKLARLAPQVVVLNAGVPGMNSSQVRDALPDLLDDFAPNVVLLMVGVADFWNHAGSNEHDLRGWRWWLRGGGWWDRSRVVKLARLIRFNLRARQAAAPGMPIVEHHAADWTIRGGEHEIHGAPEGHFFVPIEDVRLVRRILRRDLSVIATAAQARGVRLLLMTYAPEAAMYSTVNEVVRQFARDADLPLIDLGDRLQPWSEPPGAGVAFFPDFHPRRAGYELIARVIADTLPNQLGIAAPR